MNGQVDFYETVGDSFCGAKAERAYRAAQSHLIPSMPRYMDSIKRIQGKIINSIEQQI
jgi:hypothetical protein